jgi:hypothetical protein
MAYDVWPVSLPKPLFDGYTEGMADNRLRSRTDIGPPKVRRRTTANIRPIRFSMVMSDAQLVTFKNFINVTILGGTLPFIMTDPVAGGNITVQIGEAMPNWNPISNTKWLVTLDGEVMP